MSQFFELRQQRERVLQEYYTAVQRANDNRDTETEAATRIASDFRAFVVRKRWNRIQVATAYIQRIARGFAGRRKGKVKLLERANDANTAFFTHCAVTVQKVFRGYWSRHYTHSMATRKQYMNQIADIADRTNAYLKDYEEDRIAQHQEQQHLHKKDQFNNLAGQLHHLVSTKTIPGVYNSPYAYTLPTAFNVPIEQHLRVQGKVPLPPTLQRPKMTFTDSQGVRRPLDHYELGKTQASKLRGGPPQPVGKRKLLKTKTANAGRLQEIQGPFKTRDQIESGTAKAHKQYRSVQAAASYTAVAEERNMQERLAKLTRISPEDFHVKKPDEEVRRPTVNAESRYLSRPVEFRADYTELPKIKDKPPFFTSLPRDKNLADYDDKPYTQLSAV